MYSTIFPIFNSLNTSNSRRKIRAEDTVPDDKVSTLEINQRIVRVPRLSNDLLVNTTQWNYTAGIKIQVILIIAITDFLFADTYTRQPKWCPGLKPTPTIHAFCS